MAAIHTLRERIEEYDLNSDYYLMRRVPVIIVLNGRSFKKITSLLTKPFSTEFMELMCGVVIKLMQEIDGSIFGYSFNDEIILVIRNDMNHNTEAYFDNRIQKIVSAAASIATLELNRLARSNNIELFGDPTFTAKTFTTPNITEAINTLIYFQQIAFHTAITNATFYELLKTHDIDSVRQTILEKSAQEKAEILFNECGIVFEKNYPLAFRRGVAVYRKEKKITFDGVEQIKKKLTIDVELPIFPKSQEFLGSIFNKGEIK
jgi:tRNA(His) 5'-end guanylyltransferase